MKTHNKSSKLISESYIADNSEAINLIAKCANHLNISHLTHDQQILVTQLATQFELTNSNKITVSLDDYDHNNHSASSLWHHDISSQEKTLPLTTSLRGGGKKAGKG